MGQQLTTNFWMPEFLVSSTAEAHGIANTPTPEHATNIRLHLAPGLQIIRDALNVAIIITSAYRNARVNKLVGGVPKSDHTDGFAADIRAAGYSAFGLARKIAEMMKPGGPLDGLVDQLILETSRRIVHVSFAPRKRGQLLTQKAGPGSPFLSGIVA